MSDAGSLSPIKVAKVDMRPDKQRLIVRNLRVTSDKLDKIRPSYEATMVLSEQDKSTILSIPCRVVPGLPKSITVHLSEAGNRWLPRQVVKDIKLEIFDRYNNHVKEGLEIEVEVEGFSFEDRFGQVRKVDGQGFVDLGGVLKVTEGYGKPLSFFVLYDKQVLQMKKFQVEKRKLVMRTVVPEVCPAGSKLKDIVFEVVDPQGDIDETIHDEDKHGPPHTLKLRAGSPDNDSLRYVFRKGRCVVSSITLPKREGNFYIEAVHSQHPELHLKSKVTVTQAVDAEYDITSDHQVSEENDDCLSQSSNERNSQHHELHLKSKVTVTQATDAEYVITPDHQVSEENDDGLSLSSNERNPLDSVSPARLDVPTTTVSNVQDKEVYIRQCKRKQAVSSPIHTPNRKKISEHFFENIMDHPATTQSENVTSSTETDLKRKQPTLTQTPQKHSDSNSKLDNILFKSPESKVTCADPFTPEYARRLVGSELLDVEKDIHLHGSRIKEHEDQLERFKSRKYVIEDLVHKDREELLQLQASMEPVSLSVSYCLSPNEDVEEKIENKVESATALYSVVSSDTSLRDRHSMFMADVVGLVALIGTVPTHELSCSLAEYLGEDQMLAVVCQSKAAIATPEMYEVQLNSLAKELGACIKGSHLFICLEDIRAFTDGFLDGDSQKRLALSEPVLLNGKTPQGFLGFAVNMIDIGPKYLQTKTLAGHGLRETLLYRLFGELQVYKTKKDMKEAYRSGCAPHGALSLDGGILRGNGLISLGCKHSDVHFPVIDDYNQLLVTFDATHAMEQIKEISRKKQQQIEENKAELRLLEDSIAYVSQQRSDHLQQFEEKHAELLKIVEAKEASLSQQSSQTTSVNLQSLSL